MAMGTEMAQLSRQIDSLAAAVQQGLHPRARGPLTDAERRHMRAEIEGCIQKLDELRTLLLKGRDTA